MTREQAIYELERMKTWSKELSDEEIEAIVIALKALSSSEIPNTCGDAVSRAIVQEEITKSIELNENPYQLWYRIRALPSVTPQQKKTKMLDESNFDVNQYEMDLQSAYDCGRASTQQRTGRWIDDEFGSKCSCCGIYTHLDKFDRPMKFKCCSMCGAKMEVKE